MRRWKAIRKTFFAALPSPCPYGLRFPDDQENLRRQFEVCDALYAWWRLDVAKQDGR